MLAFQVSSDLRGRLGAAPSNLETTLAPPDSDLAQAITKDPYIFDIATTRAQSASFDPDDDRLAAEPRPVIQIRGLYRTRAMP